LRIKACALTRHASCLLRQKNRNSRFAGGVMKQEKYRFAVLLHSYEIIEECKKAMVGCPDEIHYDLINFETGPQKARECLENGYEVILCHGGTGDTIFRSVPHSVVKIERSDMDVLRALRVAEKYSDRIILASYQDEFHDSIAVEMERILDIKVQCAIYDSPAMMRQAIQQCVLQGFKVLIGGGVSKACMEEYGGRGFIIKPSHRSIQLAFKRGRHLAQSQREAKRRNGNMMMILEHLQEGVLCIDSEQHVLIANKAAYQFLNVPTQADESFFRKFFKPLGLIDTLSDLTPKENKIVDLQGEAFIATTYPLILYSDTPCAVSLFRDTPSLQSISNKINKVLYSRGLSARTTIDDIKGQSLPIRQMKEKLRQYAPSDVNIFIQGETGAGKELAAHALHAGSRRKNRPFVAVNISAVPCQLIESELFGYEKGAFTDARKAKAGRMEVASGGTLFLDEIGNLSLPMQAKLLTAIEKRQISRLGATDIIPIDVRLISATNVNIRELVEEGNFRQDLLYRINTIEITIPPLRERGEDVLLLADYFLQRYTHKYKKEINGLSREAKQKLMRYHWPGNVRELQHAIERAIILSDSPLLKPANFMLQPQPEKRVNTDEILNLEQLERNAIERAMKRSEGNLSRAAEYLGITRYALYRKLEKLGL
jgi:transcriptional regulator with PAS, ATPase and Fis domain